MRYVVEYIYVSKQDKSYKVFMDLAMFSCANKETALETAELTVGAVLDSFCDRILHRASRDDTDDFECTITTWSEWSDAREANGDKIIELSWARGDRPPLPDSEFTKTGDPPEHEFREHLSAT